MNDLKLGIRLLRYAYELKKNLMLLAFFIAGDILCFALELIGIEPAYTGMGGYLLCAVGMLPVQFLFSLNTASAVLSSPLRKRLQTSIPAIVSFGTMALGFFFLVLQKLAAALIQPERIEQICMQITGIALLAAVIMVFDGILYKFFIAFFGMCFAMPLLVNFYYFIFMDWNLFENKMASLMWSILLGFALITAGAAIEYGLLRLFYRKPVSPRSVGGNLKSEL